MKYTKFFYTNLFYKLSDNFFFQISIITIFFKSKKPFYLVHKLHHFNVKIIRFNKINVQILNCQDNLYSLLHLEEED